MECSWQPLNRWYLFFLWQYLCPGHIVITPSWSDCTIWGPPIPSCSHPKKLFFNLWFFFQTISPLLVLACNIHWSLLFWFVFWIHCLSLILVPQGNSFILTQFYKSNRKITGSEIISIVSETGPLVFWVIVSLLTDLAGRKVGLKWPRPLSSQVSAKAVNRESKKKANQCTVSKMCMKASGSHWWYMGMSPF